jgi:hypothetical protein
VDFKLSRLNRTDKWIIGTLESNDFKLATLENPWLDNEPYISCIPHGPYECQRVDSPRFGNTFKILNVLNRTEILFHWGNFEKDTLGCILLGMYSLPEKDMIANSRKAFGHFIKHTSDVDSLTLEID